MSKVIFVAIVALFLFSSHAAAQPYEAQRADIREIKQRMAAMLRASGTGLDSGVTRLLEAENGWWSEYTLEHPGIHHHGGAFVPALTLARVYACPRSAHYESPAVLASVEEGLQYLHTMAYPGCERVGNWWSWDIGMPLRLLPTLYLMEGVIDSELYDAYAATLVYLLRAEEEVRAEGAFVPPEEPFAGRTDTNALWIARLRLELAVLLENPAMAGKWADRAFGETNEAGEGYLQADYSYKFHGEIPMWAYGRGYLTDYANMVRTYQGTYLGPTETHLLRYGAMAGHFINGFMYRGAICPAITGREISRGPDMYMSPCGFVAADALAVSEHPEADYFAALAAREARFFGRTPARPEIEPAPPNTGIFAFPDSDFVQITRENWAVGIKMHSSRNRGYESINQENLQGWFLSHGSMFHFLDGDEWYNCWPTLDWTRLPGTTVAIERKEQNESPFVGMVRVSDDTALAAQEIRVGAFHARKLWLVDHDVIVCAGREIEGGGRVETTVVNVPLPLDAEILADGHALPHEPFEELTEVSWLWAGGVGYVFIEPTRLHLLRETRQSDWHSIRGDNVGGRGNVETQDYFTAVIQHDADATGYAYVFCPRRAAEEMPATAQSVREIYSVESGPHATRVNFPGGGAFVFWEGGAFQNVEVDRSCLLVVEDDGIHAADPAWREGELTVTVDGRGPMPLTPQRGRSVVLGNMEPL